MNKHTRYLRKGNYDPSFFAELGNLTLVIRVNRGDNGWVVILQRGYLGKISSEVKITPSPQKPCQQERANGDQTNNVEKPS